MMTSRYSFMYVLYLFISGSIFMKFCMKVTPLEPTQNLAVFNFFKALFFGTSV
jgi:hypothetical protein